MYRGTCKNKTKKTGKKIKKMQICYINLYVIFLSIGCIITSSRLKFDKKNSYQKELAIIQIFRFHFLYAYTFQKKLRLLPNACISYLIEYLEVNYKTTDTV